MLWKEVNIYQSFTQSVVQSSTSWVYFAAHFVNSDTNSSAGQEVVDRGLDG